MEKIIRLAISNMRKNKGQSISFFLITMIAAMLLYLGLITAFDYPLNFDKKAQELHAPDVSFLAQTEDPEVLREFTEELESDKNTKSVNTQPMLFSQGDFVYGNGDMSRLVAFFQRDASVEQWDFKIIGQQGKKTEDGIYLPWLFHEGGQYELGDSFSVTLSGAGMKKQKIDFKVAGFYEDIYYSTINGGATGFLLDGEEYKKLADQFEGAMNGTRFMAHLNNNDSQGYSSKYSTVLEQMIGSDKIINAVRFGLIKTARTVTATIGALFIICFSVIILVVSLVVVKFRIANSIEEEMQNIGVLRAIGYTGGQIITSFLMQFLLLALLGILLGIAAANGMMPLLSMMFTVQTGLVWPQPFSLWCMLVTIGGILISVVLVSLLSASRIRRFLPMEALRSGVASHNFKRNFLPLESSRMSLSISMAAKQFFCNIRQNIVVGLIIVGVTFAGVFAGVMYNNISMENDTFTKSVLGQEESARFTVPEKEAAENLLKELKKEKNVKSAGYFCDVMLECEGDREVYCYVAKDYSLKSDTNWCYQGRFPKHDNEAAIGGLMARQMGKEIGDAITFSYNGNEQKYLITGLIQDSNYLGQDICITEEGMQRLSGEFWVSSISVLLNQGENVETFIEQAEKKWDYITASLNVQGNIEAALGSYSIIVGIISIVIGVVTLAVVALVLYLVIKTLLIRQRRELAIKKALGFTTGQLAFYNAGAFLPVMVIGAGAGCIFSYFWLNPFLSLVFSNIGMMQMDFIISPVILMGIFAGIVFCGFLISLAVSMRIKKVTPYSLLSE